MRIAPTSILGIPRLRFGNVALKTLLPMTSVQIPDHLKPFLNRMQETGKRSEILKSNSYWVKIEYVHPQQAGDKPIFCIYIHKDTGCQAWCHEYDAQSLEPTKPWVNDEGNSLCKLEDDQAQEILDKTDLERPNPYPMLL